MGPLHVHLNGHCVDITYKNSSKRQISRPKAQMSKLADFKLKSRIKVNMVSSQSLMMVMGGSMEYCGVTPGHNMVPFSFGWYFVIPQMVSMH